MLWPSSISRPVPSARLDTTQTTNRVVIESDLQPNQPPCPSAASQGYIFSPDWSPDGTRLAFVRSGFGPAENDLCQNGLFTVNVDSGEVSQVLLSRRVAYPTSALVV